MRIYKAQPKSLISEIYYMSKGFSTCCHIGFFFVLVSFAVRLGTVFILCGQ